MPYIMEYPLGQCRSAVLVLSPPNSLCPLHTSRRVREVEMSLVLCSHCSATTRKCALLKLLLLPNPKQHHTIYDEGKQNKIDSVTAETRTNSKKGGLVVDADIAVAVCGCLFSGKKVFVQWTVLVERGFCSVILDVKQVRCWEVLSARVM